MTSDECSKPLLHGARGGLALAKVLVEKGADVDAVGSDEGGDHNAPNESCTPLWLAARATFEGEEDGPELATLLVVGGRALVLVAVTVYSAQVLEFGVADSY